MQAAYRDASEGLAQRHVELVACRRREIDALDPALRRVYVRRVARVACGVVLVGGALATLISGAAGSRFAEHALGWTWPLALLAWLVALSAADVRLTSRLLFETRGGELERWSVEDHVVAMADRLELASLALPLAGFGLCIAMAIHCGYAGTPRPLREIFVAGLPAYLAGAWALVAHARRVRGESTVELAHGSFGSAVGSMILVCATAASWGGPLILLAGLARPGALATAAVTSGAAVVLAVVTTALLAPALLRWAHTRVVGERGALGI